MSIVSVKVVIFTNRQTMIRVLVVVALCIVTLNAYGLTELKDSSTFLSELAKQHESFVVQTRRHLHAHPEMSWREENTLQYIRDRVSEIIEESPAVKQGLVLIVRHDRDAHLGGIWYDVQTTTDSADHKEPVLLLRADIDALPITERTNLSFASTNAGVMHACGHDMHTAMLLGALRSILSLSNADQLSLFSRHRLRFLFQRAEEDEAHIGLSGAQLLAKSSTVLDGVIKAYGLHVNPGEPLGRFDSRAGAIMGRPDYFNVNITCPGGHVGMAHNGVNCLRVFHAIQSALDTISHRVLSALEPSAIEFTNVKAGSGAPNVMAQLVQFSFTARNMLTGSRLEDFLTQIEQEIRDVFHTFERQAQKRNIVGDFSIDIQRVSANPTTYNHAKVYQETAMLLSNAFGLDNVVEAQATLGAEDFSYILEKVPGVFWFVGAHQQGTGDYHTDIFNPSEDVMRSGVKFWLAVASQN